MALLIFIIIVLIVVSLLVWAVQMLPITPPINQIIMALIVVMGALVIANKAGVF